MVYQLFNVLCLYHCLFCIVWSLWSSIVSHVHNKFQLANNIILILIKSDSIYLNDKKSGQQCQQCSDTWGCDDAYDFVLFILEIQSIVPSLLSEATEVCFDHSCYELVLLKASKNAAKLYCTSAGGHVVALETLEENNFVSNAYAHVGKLFYYLPNKFILILFMEKYQNIHQYSRGLCLRPSAPNHI